MINTLLKFAKYVLLIGVGTFFVEWLTDYSAFQVYKEYSLRTFIYIYTWINWVIIALFIYTLSLKGKTKVLKFTEMLREKRFFYDVDRWSCTPYISPIHYTYMLTPLESINNNIQARVFDSFYQKVVNSFRDKVYSTKNFSSYDPKNRISFIRVVGLFTLAKYYLPPFLLLSLTAYLISLKPLTFWYEGLGQFVVPFAAYSFILIVFLTKTLIHHSSWELVDHEILQQLGEKDPRIAWTSLNQHTEQGRLIIAAWKTEMENRGRREYQLRGQPVPDNPKPINHYNIAPFPYPPETERFHVAGNKVYEVPIEKINQLQTNVIPFKRKI
ncbi:hypothetical protein BpOF4_20749 (plasmid) [Alkalihalophilus pseudofirmus OF4]|uniref:Uncharacterized protein n=1 Tax=Alkalihalophilus pseudofirmus (strain ATCC BAA-2126 / JCM 17055 / OF4) TaxID=398511 RepID=D3G1B9_ALKPO|nr:hypothetical protein [Alkalihalophilus pseudofirmus]ADC52145.1 hypothetical protein BpOF4_20749 [Alkalihalophilus pseudofirmus OF4]